MFVVGGVTVVGCLILRKSSSNGTPPATPMFVESVYTVSHWGRGHRHFADPPPVTTLCEVSQSGVQAITSHTFKNQLNQAVDTRNVRLPGECSGGLCVVKRERFFEFTFKGCSYRFCRPPLDSFSSMSPTFALSNLYLRSQYLVGDIKFYDDNFFQGFKYRDHYMAIWKKGRPQFVYRLKIQGGLTNVEW